MRYLKNSLFDTCFIYLSPEIRACATVTIVNVNGLKSDYVYLFFANLLQ